MRLRDDRGIYLHLVVLRSSGWYAIIFSWYLRFRCLLEKSDRSKLKCQYFIIISIYRLSFRVLDDCILLFVFSNFHLLHSYFLYSILLVVFIILSCTLSYYVDQISFSDNWLSESLTDLRSLDVHFFSNFQGRVPV